MAPRGWEHDQRLRIDLMLEFRVAPADWSDSSSTRSPRPRNAADPSHSARERRSDHELGAGRQIPYLAAPLWGQGTSVRADRVRARVAALFSSSVISWRGSHAVVAIRYKLDARAIKHLLWRFSDLVAPKRSAQWCVCGENALLMVRFGFRRRAQNAALWQ